MNGPRTGVHGKMVLDHLPGDPEHVGRFPRKHVNICPEESDEHIFLFLPQLCPYGDGLLGIIPKADRLVEGGAVRRNALFSRRMGRRLGAFHIVGGRGRHRLVESLGAVHRALHVSLDGDDPGWARELEGVVGIVYLGH